MIGLLLNFIKGDEKSVQRNSVIWNMIASLLYSFQSMILLLVVTRFGDLILAGIFSISYSVSQMFASIGSFSMRDFQVSDTNREYSFPTYFASRVVSLAVMVISCMTYALLHGYSGTKLLIVFLLSIYRVTDGYDDVIHGELQKRGRLDMAAKIMAFRIAMSSVIFVGVFLIFRNIILSTVCLTVIAICISFFLNRLIMSTQNLMYEFDFRKIWNLFIACTPVCAGAFIYNYLNNSPKYAIDNVLNEEMQTIFAIIFMPVFVINMLGGFIFKPHVHKMGELWNSGEKKQFLMLIFKQLVIIIGIAILVIIGGAFLGMPVLSLLYGIELGEYKWHFVVLLVFGAIAAINTFGTVIITVMRKQKFVMVSYVLALIIDVIFMNKLVEKYALWGAGLVYGMVVATIMTVYILVIIFNLIKTDTSTPLTN